MSSPPEAVKTNRTSVVRRSALSTLLVTPQYRDASGKVQSLLPIPVSALAHGTWAPTLPLPILLSTATNGVLSADLRTTDVRFVFTASGGLLTSGKWRVDALWVDPIVANW